MLMFYVPFNELVFLQTKLCLEKMNGISLVHVTGSIQMEKDQTELQLQVIGRLRVPTSLY